MTLESMSEAELWDIATPIMDNLMDGSTEIEHSKHTRDFSQRMLNIVTPEYLDKVCKSYQTEKGFFAVREPVAIFNRPDSIAFIWKQHFTKVNGEFVAEMVLIQDGSKYLVDHVMIF
ncbi:hypothetical protein AKG98_1344 [Moritella sp. JT01]|uniref:hypothetical protein n=1 Tax=Moritella sp. JT01 TaxID=756698 RepID=UPI00079B39AB|nr:hypothetical protein [Moritella sp. JT01]KXO09135.1 hypothetical protein AKG98_1344 [Moritella sp. JT01]